MSRGILIVGASGFVGRSLSRRFLASGRKVVGISRRSPGTAVEWVPVEGAAAKITEYTVRKYGAEAVVHCGGRINGSAKELYRDNEKLTEDVIRGVQESGVDALLVYVSSVSAINELGAYGRSKRNCERLIERSQLQRWIILRPALLYGDDDTKNVASLVRWVRGSPIVPYPSSRDVRLQPLFVGDLFRAVCAVVDSKGRNRATYVIAGPRQERLVDMIRAIQDCYGRRNILLPIPLKPVQVFFRLLCTLFPTGGLPVQQITHLHSHPPHEVETIARELEVTPIGFKEGIRECMLGA